MHFDTVTFWLFFAIAWAVWRLLPIRAAQAGTLALSLIFYAWWRPEYVLLIWLSSFADYHLAARIAASEAPAARNRWLTASLVLNLGFLGFFKYTPFVLDTLGLGRATDGLARADWLETWVVPVGISFYTFQSLSYTIDVHARRMRPARSYLEYFTFVSFFPQLVAGPIVRARELLPQLRYRRKLSWVRVQMGLYRCITGLFLKIVVADGLAPSVESVFNPARVGNVTPAGAWMGVMSFGVQVFADFAGYSGIAIGLAHLLGIRFPENFRSPYIARSLSEFWTRWHITLSRWLRDYLYIPLGGSRHGRARTFVNLFITMFLSGLWHGAAWTYVVWGAIHGLGLAIERALAPAGRSHMGPDPVRGPRDFVVRCVRIALVLFFIHVAYVFFRASSLSVVTTMLERMFVTPFQGDGDWGRLLTGPQLALFAPVILMHAGQAVHEWFGLKKRTWMRVVACVVWLFFLCVVNRADASPFVYFQF